MLTNNERTPSELRANAERTPKTKAFKSCNKKVNEARAKLEETKKKAVFKVLLKHKRSEKEVREKH